MLPLGVSCTSKTGEDVCMFPNLCEKVYSVRVVCCSLGNHQSGLRNDRLVASRMEAQAIVLLWWTPSLRLDELNLRLTELTRNLLCSMPG